MIAGTRRASWHDLACEVLGQALFAGYLNVTTTYVSQHERGARCPRSATLKLPLLIKIKELDAVLQCCNGRNAE